MVKRDELKRVLAAIPRSHYETSGRIAQKAGLARSRTNERVRAAIKELRLRGVPIVSCSQGFKLSHDPLEIAACVRNLRERERGIRLAREALECYVRGGTV